MLEAMSDARETSSKPFAHLERLELDSTLESLLLYDSQIEITCQGKEVIHRFQNDLSLPGIILVDRAAEFRGMISRWRFWEHMSRPYSLDLFYKRSLNSLYSFTQTEILRLKSDTTIVEAARKSLERKTELLYEPIVVENKNSSYFLLDIHQLLMAQSRIHELTSQLLEEKTYAHRVQTEKMASLGRAMAGVAHEIRNPVNSIDGNLEFIDEYSNNLVKLLKLYQEEVTIIPDRIANFEEKIELQYLLEDLPKVVQTMQVSAERLTHLVTGLRNFARVDDTKRQVVNLSSCIEGTLLILHNQIKNAIEVIRDYEDLPDIECYPGQLSQVFMNLLSNAIDTLMERKEVETDPQWQPQITIATQTVEEPGGDRAITIIIADNGMGIAPKTQAQIFEEFFTTKPVGKGTGLGLAISQRIIAQKHGGQIKLRSEVGVGTAFEVTIPVRKWNRK